jgi:membrane-associated protease RseP (regulator of RpoE activity)
MRSMKKGNWAIIAISVIAGISISTALVAESYWIKWVGIALAILSIKGLVFLTMLRDWHRVYCKTNKKIG